MKNVQCVWIINATNYFEFRKSGLGTFCVAESRIFTRKLHWQRYKVQKKKKRGANTKSPDARRTEARWGSQILLSLKSVSFLPTDY